MTAPGRSRRSRLTAPPAATAHGWVGSARSAAGSDVIPRFSSKCDLSPDRLGRQRNPCRILMGRLGNARSGFATSRLKFWLWLVILKSNWVKY